MLPEPHGGRNLELDPGTELRIELNADLPHGVDAGRDVLKVLAAQQETTFRWLEMPRLDAAPTTWRGDPGCELERWLAALCGGGPLHRGSGPVHRGSAAGPWRGDWVPGEDWTTAQVSARVVRGIGRW